MIAPRNPEWTRLLAPALASPSMAALRQFLADEAAGGQVIYPPQDHWFRALDLTPPGDVRVVILGQDPYHGPGQAHGLCFSVEPDVRVPPSLKNIYKELKSDLNIDPPAHGFLEHWAQQGVLLLNNVLTVAQGKAASHKGRGWEAFTDAVVAQVNALPQPVVFMLWGSPAQEKAGAVDDRHLVLKSVHPSPLSAYRGFFGCRHFSQANAFLTAQGRGQIDWKLPSFGLF